MYKITNENGMCAWAPLLVLQHRYTKLQVIPLSSSNSKENMWLREKNFLGQMSKMKYILTDQRDKLIVKIPPCVYSKTCKLKLIKAYTQNSRNYNLRRRPIQYSVGQKGWRRSQFKSLNHRKGKANPQLKPKRCYDGTLTVQVAIKNDVMELLPLINPVFTFFTNHSKHLKILDLTTRISMNIMKTAFKLISFL